MTTALETISFDRLIAAPFLAANQAQAEMINGVINYLEDKGIEEDMSSINRYLQRFATKIVQTYTFL